MIKQGSATPRVTPTYVTIKLPVVLYCNNYGNIFRDNFVKKCLVCHFVRQIKPNQMEEKSYLKIPRTRVFQP